MPNTPWPHESAAALRALWAAAAPAKEIAATVGKTVPAVLAKKDRLELGNRYNGWTEEHVERLKFLWERGDTCSQIAREIGGSRNAIIGKVHRLGLPQRKKGTSPAQKLRSARDRKVYIRPLKPIRAAIAPIPANAPEPRNLTILDLATADCRWPVTPDHPMLFCGHAAIGELPYCGYHSRIAYQPLRPRR